MNLKTCFSRVSQEDSAIHGASSINAKVSTFERGI